VHEGTEAGEFLTKMLVAAFDVIVEFELGSAGGAARARARWLLHKVG
jgi:hypothetical protein